MVELLGVEMDTDGGFDVDLRDGDVGLVIVVVEELVVVELLKSAVVDLDVCVARVEKLIKET